MKTFSTKPSDITRQWYVVDATNVPLGRLAVEVAKILHGKHKPIFVPNLDTGDHVIVINAGKVRLSGRKAEERIYWHTLWPGGLRSITKGDMLVRNATKLVRRSVKGMLPSNKLGDAMLTKLKVYEGAQHPHEAQQPIELKIDARNGE